MHHLDDLDLYRRLDPSGMRERIDGLPQQCRDAWQAASDLPLPEDYHGVDQVIVLGMGGSAIGGDLARALAMEEERSVQVHRDYGLPYPTSASTLIIASSYSGNTEETISAFSQALDTPARKLAITTGGTLGRLAHESGIPCLRFHYPSEPRAALGYSLFSLLAILARVGCLSLGPGDIEETAALLERQASHLTVSCPAHQNQAKQLAARLNGHLVVIYGAGFLSSVARRWKTQLNENSKAWAFDESLPELNHNAVVGYQAPPWMAEKAFVVMLKAPSLHGRLLARYQVTSELLTSGGIAHEVIDASGASLLGQMMSTIMLGDYVSYYLAVLGGIDPSPVEAIDYLKSRLGKTGPR